MPKKIASGDNVKIFVDLSEILSFVAAGTAIPRALRTKKYADSLFDVAFAEADEEFNIRAAAYAQTTGNIAHMYEWGTLGINKGQTNMRPNPMSPVARLWETKAVGRGFDQTVTYSFKPSHAYVPKPTGLPPTIKSMLRQHKFIWKSEVMEWGRLVEVRPTNGRLLLIPINKENKQYARKTDIRRGYMMTPGPEIFYAGGERYANKFTEFFMGYWSTAGSEIINKSIERQFMVDYEPKLRYTQRYSSLQPASTTKSIKQRVEERVREYQKLAERAGYARARAAKAKRAAT